MATTLPGRKSGSPANPAPVGQEDKYVRLADVNGLLDHVAGSLNIKSYGAVGDGTTDDTAAFQEAITTANAAGVPLILSNGATYSLGTLAAGASKFALTGARLKIIGNGATISTTTSGAGQGYVFDLTNPVFAEFENLTFANPGADLSVDWQGVHHVRITASGASGAFGGVVFRSVRVTGGVSSLTIAGGAATARIRGVRFEGDCVFSNVYYGSLYQNQGDDVTGSYRAVNVRRAYYAYGVSGHRVNLWVSHDGVALGGSAAVLISGEATIPTRDLRIRATFSGSLLSYASAVKFQSTSTAGSAIIEDVHVDLSLTGASWTNGTMPVLFASYNDGGTLLGTSGNKWDKIRLSGDFIRGTGLAQSIAMWTTQTTKGKLILDPIVAGASGAELAVQWPGFYSSYVAEYAEGTWTPTDLSGAGLTFTNTTNNCRWTKIGRMVYASFRFTFPSTADGATAVIGGLPFASANSNSIFAGAIGYTTHTTAVTLLVAAQDTKFNFYTLGASVVTNATLSTKDFRGVIVYEAG